MTAKPTVSISSLTFSSGQEIQIKPNEKILFVGPNNSGKSQALREIELFSRQHINPPTSLAINDIEFIKSGSVDDFNYWITKNAYFDGNRYNFLTFAVHPTSIAQWNLYKPPGEALYKLFINNIDTLNRLRICEQQNSLSQLDVKTKPQHVLYDNQSLLEKISALFRRAFGQDIVFDFRGGARLPIHIGQKPHCGDVVDRVGDDYVHAVRKNPLLDLQGDGIKSYAGILFEAIAVNLDITLIDEPEAFLHPPQMRRLGETLAQEVKGQLIVATHSSDIMRGFLEGTQGNVRILRIRKKGDVNFVTEADPDIIRELWEQPNLRYSNALEGIFHEQTIICEDDSDCRLINSVADFVAASSAEPWKDTAYVPAGGKHAIPKIAAVLRKIGVPVKAVFDMDFLSEQELVQSAFEAFGGSWNEIECFWWRIDAGVRQGIKPKTKSDIKKEIVDLLGDLESDELPKRDIIDAMKHDKPWNIVKQYGEAALPGGELRSDYRALKDGLEEVGIYFSPVGEIEKFCPEIGLHGPRFVTKLLATKSLGDGDLEALRAFVEKVHKA